jgi:hypothetical protein
LSAEQTGLKQSKREIERVARKIEPLCNPKTQTRDLDREKGSLRPHPFGEFSGSGKSVFVLPALAPPARAPEYSYECGYACHITNHP